MIDVVSGGRGTGDGEVLLSVQGPAEAPWAVYLGIYRELTSHLAAEL